MRTPRQAAAVLLGALAAAGVAAWALAGGGAGPAVAQQAGGDTLSAAEQAIRAHRRAGRGPSQPLPFSHRFHSAELRLDCEYCHTAPQRSAVVRMPPTSTCMGCHQIVGSGLAPIEDLRSYASRGEPIPWRRVYKVPEFVQFTHRAHVRSQLDCAECHGPVEEMDRVYKFSDLSMGWCLNCHRQEPQPTDVATDHRLVRQADVPPPPEGRQPIGLYPYQIDQHYAATRAPTDCATCHY